MRASRLLLSALLLAVALVGVQAPAAQAAVGCTYTGCTGKNPNVQNCSDDARTADSFQISNPPDMGYNLGHILVELRHSDACHARWVRLTWTPSDFGCGGGWPLRGRVRDFGPRSYVLSSQAKTIGGCGTAFSDMVGRNKTAPSFYTDFCLHAMVNGDPSTPTCKTQSWP